MVGVFEEESGEGLEEESCRILISRCQVSFLRSTSSRWRKGVVVGITQANSTSGDEGVF